MVADPLMTAVEAAEGVMPIHKARLMTYLRLSGQRVGLLLIFNTAVLEDDIHRLTL